MSVSYSDVLGFWFAPEQEARWFVKEAQFDSEVRERFLKLYSSARSGALEAWSQEPSGMLALILIFDQFPRNMFRNMPQAFATDAQALTLTKAGMARGFDKAFTGERLGFFYMPLMHSEDLADQELSVAVYKQAGLSGHVPYAQAHRDIIARFGRYPHRNKILGRVSLPEEVEFLKGPNSSF